MTPMMAPPSDVTGFAARLPVPEEVVRTANEPAPLASCTRGAVYVEFLVAFLPLFVMILGLTQIALVYVGDLVVHHAATVAVRAAIVVLPDDPDRYGGAAVNRLTDRADGCGPGAVEAFIARVASGTGVSALPGCGAGSSGGSGVGAVYANRNERMRAIHDAASLATVSISPTLQQLDPATYRRSSSVAEALGTDAPVYRAAAGPLQYNRAALAVTFPESPNANAFRDRYDTSEHDVTVRVTYLFHCAVPIARMLVCRSLGDVRPAARAELGAAPNAAVVSTYRAARFVALRAEATMPIQRARYDY